MEEKEDDDESSRIEMKLKLSRFLPNNELHSCPAKSRHLFRIGTVVGTATERGKEDGW